jgi:hypothetical protein
MLNEKPLCGKLLPTREKGTEMRESHREFFTVLRQCYHMPETEIASIKLTLMKYKTDDEKEEYIKGIIWEIGQKNKAKRLLTACGKLGYK